MRINGKSVLDALYDSEINATVSSFWDGGFTVKLGDDMNGFVAEAEFKTFAEAEVWLIGAACKHYPNSVFASAGAVGGKP
jgi:hypothetical protein